MITLSNSHSFELVTASGALGYDGRGWPHERWILEPLGVFKMAGATHITKTLTLKPWPGNLHWYKPWQVIKFIPDGVVNAIGFTNPGFDSWYQKYVPRINAGKLPPLIVSLTTFLEADRELVNMAERLNDVGIVGVEYNPSCPNKATSGGLNADVAVRHCEAIKTHCRHPVLIKIGVTTPWRYLMQKLDGMVEAININSVPWREVFPNQRSPLDKFGGGGVSGRAAQPKNWELIQQLSKITAIPVIGCSVWTPDDIHTLYNQCNVPAIALGSMCLRHPCLATQAAHLIKERQTRQPTNK